ncbi:uncharacterized protein LOC141533572 [Cotesia typhae]|uniref:uncharacterized protein LOC141533572 n=1 Tax=Cotesia typhae TaxID=2053667 RepID=UPI003D69D112
MSYTVEFEGQRDRKEWKEEKKSDQDDGDERIYKIRENSPQYIRRFREIPDLSRPINNYMETDRSRENSPRYKRRFRETPPDLSRPLDRSRENSPRNLRCFRRSPEDFRPRKRYRSRDNSPKYRRRSRETSRDSRPSKRYRSRDNSPRNQRRFRRTPEDSRLRKRYRSRENSPRYRRRSRESSSEDSRPSKRYKEFRTVAIQTDITALQQSQQALETLFDQISVVPPAPSSVVPPVASNVVPPPVEPTPGQKERVKLPLDGDTLPVLPCLTRNQKRQQNRRNSLMRILTSGIKFDEQRVLKLWKKAATSEEYKLFNSHLERLRKERDSSLGILHPSSHLGVFLNQSRCK